MATLSNFKGTVGWGVEPVGVEEPVLLGTDQGFYGKNHLWRLAFNLLNLERPQYIHCFIESKHSFDRKIQKGNGWISTFWIALSENHLHGS